MRTALRKTCVILAPIILAFSLCVCAAGCSGKPSGGLGETQDMTYYNMVFKVPISWESKYNEQNTLVAKATLFRGMVTAQNVGNTGYAYSDPESVIKDVCEQTDCRYDPSSFVTGKIDDAIYYRLPFDTDKHRGWHEFVFSGYSTTLFTAICHPDDFDARGDQLKAILDTIDHSPSSGKLIAPVFKDSSSPPSTSTSTSAKQSSKSASSTARSSASAKVVSNDTDFNAVVKSCDSSGITFTFTNPDDSYKCIIFPKSVLIGSTKYEDIGDSVHLTQNGKDVSAGLEIAEGGSADARLSIEGVSDYTNLTVVLDNTLYNNTRTFTMKDLKIVVG